MAFSFTEGTLAVLAIRAIHPPRALAAIALAICAQGAILVDVVAFGIHAYPISASFTGKALPIDAIKALEGSDAETVHADSLSTAHFAFHAC